MKFAINFTNFGPYHLARLRALGDCLALEGHQLISHEIAGSERRYPWLIAKEDEPFTWTTLFPSSAVEDISHTDCKAAMTEALHRDRPDAVAVCGYSRPESMAALKWAEVNDRPAILMSETQKMDHPRTWWKEAVKRNRVKRFSSALVGGPRHRDYLIELGMPASRIALGYNAVDNESFAANAEAAWHSSSRHAAVPSRPYFLAVNRFVPEKNLPALIRAFASYRASATDKDAWDLVLCGGGPDEGEIEAAIAASDVPHAIHRPGFLQANELSQFYAFAGGFIHPSLMEPWGLVVNEAAACGLPLLVSERAGCVETLVSNGVSGKQFDPHDEASMTSAMAWLTGLSRLERTQVGRGAAEVVAAWGPDRFASGMMEALAKADARKRRSKTSSPLATGARE